MERANDSPMPGASSNSAVSSKRAVPHSFRLHPHTISLLFFSRPWNCLTLHPDIETRCKDWSHRWDSSKKAAVAGRPEVLLVAAPVRKLPYHGRDRQASSRIADRSAWIAHRMPVVFP